MHQEIKFKITGTVPILLHNVRLGNPMDPYKKVLGKLTSKKTKQDADYEKIARVEWEGGLYLHDGIVQLPARMIEATFGAGAKVNKNGQKFKTGAMSRDDFYPLIYSGPKVQVTNGNGEIPITELDGVWLQHRHQEMMKVITAKVLRTRPRFENWSIADVGIIFNSERIEADELVQAAQNAGQYCGFGDSRPRFGRFEVEVL